MKYAKLIVPVMLLTANPADANLFEGLYELGKKKNLLIKAQNALQDSNKQQENLAFASLLPSVNLLGNWNYQRQNQQIQSDSFLLTIPDRRNQADGFGYEVSVTQPLFNLPAYYSYKRGQEVSGLAEIEKEQARMEFIQEYSLTYLNVIADALRIDNIEQTLASYRAQRNLIAKQYETGFVKPSDLQQAEAQLATLEAELIVVKNRMDVSFKRLELLLQSDVHSVNGLGDVLTDITPLDKPVQDYVFKFENNLDYRVAVANVSIAEKDLRVSSNIAMPSVAASLRYSDNHFDNSFDFQTGNTLYQDGFSVAVQLTVPLYAGSRDTYQTRLSAYSHESAKYQKQFIQHQTKQAIRATYLNVKAGIASVKSRQHSVAASQSALTNANTEYQAGIGQYTDVRNSQDRLFEQTNRLIDDKVNLINNYFIFARLIGENPDETITKIKTVFNGEVIKNES